MGKLLEKVLYMAEQVTVIAQAPVVDVTQSGLSTSHTKDALEKPDILVAFNYIYQSGRPTLKNVRIPGLNQPFVKEVSAIPLPRRAQLGVKFEF